MGTVAFDLEKETYRRLAERCIGCGLCALACDRQQAIRMELVPDYKLPYRSWYSLIARTAPTAIQGSWNAWRARRTAGG